MQFLFFTRSAILAFYCFVFDGSITAELLSGVRKEMEGGRLPLNVAATMEEIYHNYRNAVSKQI